MIDQGINLFLVPTPIGNLKDITLRAIEILKSADVILAEDTRTSGSLLKHLEISRPLQSYHIFNEHKTVQRLVDRMKAGEVQLTAVVHSTIKQLTCRAIQLLLQTHRYISNEPRF